MFNRLLPVIEDIDHIRAIETKMWSDKLELAGTVDLIAKYKGKLSVIDWKTSNGYKAKTDIPDYFLQTSIYAYMFWERTGIPIEQVVIVIATDGFGTLVYEEDVRNHLPQAFALRQKMREVHGI